MIIPGGFLIYLFITSNGFILHTERETAYVACMGNSMR